MKIQIALAQINTVLGDLNKNLERHLELASNAVENKAATASRSGSANF